MISFLGVGESGESGESVPFRSEWSGVLRSVPPRNERRKARERNEQNERGGFYYVKYNAISVIHTDLIGLGVAEWSHGHTVKRSVCVL